MKLDDTTLGVLKDLESAVIGYWRGHRDFTDHAVGRVYEAAIDHYDAEKRGRRPRPHGLTGTDLEVYERIFAACEYRLGRGPRPDTSTADVPAQPLEVVLRCLRELGKSVETHTVISGPQGYLHYVNQFVPKV